MNTLIVIGWLGIKTCYLNVPREEAIARYLKEEDITDEKYIQDLITEFTFTDQFCAYDAYE